MCKFGVWNLECIFWKWAPTFIRFTETTYNLLLTQDICPAPFLSTVTSSLLTKWRTKLTSWPLALGAANLRKKEKRSSRLCDNNTNAGGGNRGLTLQMKYCHFTPFVSNAKTRCHYVLFHAKDILKMSVQRLPLKSQNKCFCEVFFRCFFNVHCWCQTGFEIKVFTISSTQVTDV